MRPDGGEARRITDAREGVANFDITPDGRWVIYRSGKTDEEQLYALAVADVTAGTSLDSLKAVALTKHPTGITQWRVAPDARRVYFVTADTVDRDEKARMEKKFNVAIRNAETPVSSLWSLDVDNHQIRRLTRDTTSWLALAPWFVLAGIGIGCAETAEHTAVAQDAPLDIRGSAFGLLAAIQSIGNLAASTIAGILWTTVSPTWAFGFLAAAMIVATGLIARRPQL
jgi:hypothetical protein